MIKKYKSIFEKTSDNNFVRKPCGICPFRKDVKPYLHPERGAELAYASQNKYNDFPCHGTVDYNHPDSKDGEGVVTDKSKTCAGFLTLQVHNGTRCPDNFTPSALIYEDTYDMVNAYTYPEEFEPLTDSDRKSLAEYQKELDEQYGKK